MACLANALSFFFLLVLNSSLHIQARESKFFSKVTGITTDIKVTESQISPIFAPTLAPTTAPTPAAAAPTPTIAPAAAPMIENGYGIYGHESNQFPPTKESETTTSDENDLLNEELSAESYVTGNQKSNYKNNEYTTSYNNNNNNKGYNTNYNTNGYETAEKQGMSDTRFMDNYKRNVDNANNYNNNVYTSSYNDNEYTSNKGYTGNYNNNVYDESEKKGMSDTRYVENGKYYYDVKNENNYDPIGYESERSATKNEGNYYGNTQNTYEFNTMEEYENQQYQQKQEKYGP